MFATSSRADLSNGGVLMAHHAAALLRRAIRQRTRADQQFSGKDLTALTRISWTGHVAAQAGTSWLKCLICGGVALLD